MLQARPYGRIKNGGTLMINHWKEGEATCDGGYYDLMKNEKALQVWAEFLNQKYGMYGVDFTKGLIQPNSTWDSGPKGYSRIHLESEIPRTHWGIFQETSTSHLTMYSTLHMAKLENITLQPNRDDFPAEKAEVKLYKGKPTKASKEAQEKLDDLAYRKYSIAMDKYYRTEQVLGNFTVSISYRGNGQSLRGRYQLIYEGYEYKVIQCSDVYRNDGWESYWEEDDDGKVHRRRYGMRYEGLEEAIDKHNKLKEELAIKYGKEEE